MKIGDAAEQSGLPVKTIRYYDEIELVSPGRAQSGYRTYSASDIHRLQFVSRSRSLGFSLEDCRHLLSLYEDKSRASSSVKQIVQEKLQEVDRKIKELQGLRNTLVHLSDNCRGDSRPDCPILDDLSGASGEKV